MAELADAIEADFRRWPAFDKTARVAAHSPDGVIELMPISDGRAYGFKYVNGIRGIRPRGARRSLRSSGAGGCRNRLSRAVVRDDAPDGPSDRRHLGMCRPHLADAGHRPWPLSAMAPRPSFRPSRSDSCGGVRRLRLFDIEPAATAKCRRNLQAFGFEVIATRSAEEAVEGADIVTTVTADKRNATILTDNMVGAGQHLNAVGGDCPGKTELHRDILLRSEIFVEYPPQTRIEGEIQQLDPDHPVTELWRVVFGAMPPVAGMIARLRCSTPWASRRRIFSALVYVREKLRDHGSFEQLDLLADPDDPRDLFGMLMRAGEG